MQHIRAWRKSTLDPAVAQVVTPADDSISPLGAGILCPGPLGSGALVAAGAAAVAWGPERLTEHFQQTRRLDFHERLVDGFRDVGVGGGPRGAGSNPFEATFVVDRRADEVLAEFLDRAGKKLARANDPATRVMIASLLVSEALGRSGAYAVNILDRYERLVLERMDAAGLMKLGAIMSEPAPPGSAGGGKTRQPGAGAVRHRALLLKAVADWLGLAPCALCRNESGATWNVLLVDGEPFIVDVAFDPGAMYEQGSGKATEYLKRVQQQSCSESSNAANSSSSGIAWRRRDSASAAPSMQQNLGGRMLRPSWHVEPCDIEFDRRDRAGRGGFGEVFQGAWAGQIVAVKEVREATPTDGDVCDFILEISLLSMLSHPNIIRFWRGCVDLRGGHRALMLVTEWMDRGVLSTLLHESQEPELTLGQTHVLLIGIGRGVAYLHHVKILHLDLKSPNVLLNSSFQPKLCDFGLAKLREQTALHTTLRGVSPIWAPPEMFVDNAGGVTEKADVYSFGIIIFEAATRKLPFSELTQMQLPRIKAKGQLPRFPDDMEDGLGDLCRLCLTHKATNRPSMLGAIARIEQNASSRGIDIREQQTEMEQRGLHFGGPSGSTPNVEQLQRAEAEKRRADSEVSRLRKILHDEEARVLALEAGVARWNVVDGPSNEDRSAEIESFCNKNTKAVADSKFRCTICRKLFRGPEFVHKHIRERHAEEMLLGSSVVSGAAAETPIGSVASLASPVPSAVLLSEAKTAQADSDSFFDADVAEELNLRIYTNKIVGDASLAGGFNQDLQDAAEMGDASKLQQCLLQGGSSVNQSDEDGSKPLHLAARHGHVGCVEYLVSNAADARAVTELGLTALHLAAQSGHARVCEILLEASAVVDEVNSEKARSPLHLAAAGGHREVAGLLLLRKACVNLQDEDGESPLHTAARFGDRDLCEIILSWGAAVNLSDGDGWSPLHEAARWGDGLLVESLLQRGADTNARSNDGESALHVVPGGYAELEVVDVLLAWRCDVNSKDYDGETALHVAVKLGDVELAGVLLSSGADANAANMSGATPLDFAKKDELRWLLRSHKARKGTGSA
eukprot:TRINITY_DN1836_c0_g1_i1.p1 TRINITY_DN1836_c0_g1~~TRINITY_DN1836_c0_g1_i1.p1  ORF type:complete len:1096 (-),score=164.71 TRINITY_DN1836_c0_g1_i1:59-3295(-)